MHCFINIFVAAVFLSALPAAARAEDDCSAPVPVCAARTAVFPIEAADPFASAVRIAPDLLVTNRHVVEDRTEAQVILPRGRYTLAEAVPTSFPGDLILLRAADLPPGPILRSAAAEAEGEIYTIGADSGTGGVRVYAPGPVRFLPAEGKPRARLHHGAHSQPGNSGGALVNAEGKLVGVVASGGEGNNEAVPAAQLSRLLELSGPAHREASRHIGAAYRDCVAALARPRSGGLARCRDTGNRQMIGDAGRALGRLGQLEESIAYLEAGLDLDPNAINARLSLVISLHIARRYAAELPHLAWLLEVIPADPQALRLALQAGKWGGDRDLAARALALLEEHHPQMAQPARAFLESDQPAPGQ